MVQTFKGRSGRCPDETGELFFSLAATVVKRVANLRVSTFWDQNSTGMRFPTGSFNADIFPLAYITANSLSPRQMLSRGLDLQARRYLHRASSVRQIHCRS